MSKKNIKISAIKGMKDILPEEAQIWQLVEKKAKDVFERFNYQELRLPICEKTDLFKRSIGSSTDIVEKEMFTFKDRNGESISLRPEGTASLVRACVENNLLAPGQLKKFYYIGPMFRYEKPQKGRQRQFHQLGVEALGIDDPLIDVELILSCHAFLVELGLSDFSVEINSLGLPESRKKFKRELIKFLDSSKKSLCKKCLERKDRNPLRIFDCKENPCKALAKGAPKILDHLDNESKKDFETVKNELRGAGIAFIVNPHTVRGLDYYTKTVFEFRSKALGAQDAILGGGRYNSLVGEIGGPDTPASGFALGVERLILLLKEKFSAPARSLVYIASLGEPGKKAAFDLALKMRAKGIITECEFQNKSLKWQLGRSDKLGASFTVIIGDEEIEKNSYTLRNMKTKEQLTVNPDEMPDLVKSLTEETK